MDQSLLAWDERPKMLSQLLVMDVLIIHLGGNNIGNVGTQELLDQTKKSLIKVKQLFPEIVIIFSEIVPKLLWLRAKQ